MLCATRELRQREFIKMVTVSLLITSGEAANKMAQNTRGQKRIIHLYLFCIQLKWCNEG